MSVLMHPGDMAVVRAWGASGRPTTMSEPVSWPPVVHLIPAGTLVLIVDVVTDIPSDGIAPQARVLTPEGQSLWVWQIDLKAVHT